MMRSASSDTDSRMCSFGACCEQEAKTPYRDGATHVIFEPLDFIARLAALVSKPRANLTRFHGVFAPNSTLRVGNDAEETPAQRRAAMSLKLSA